VAQQPCPCPLCDEACTTENEAREHVKTRHLDCVQKLTSELPQPRLAELRARGELDDWAAGYILNMSRHTATQPDGSGTQWHRCKQCGARFRGRLAARLHVVESHTTLYGEDPSELYEAETPDFATMSTTSLRDFYDSKRPSDHKDRITVFAYWLTRKEGKREFRTSDLSRCYREAKQKTTNTTTIVTRLYKDGILTKGFTPQTHMLTRTGEELVEKGLPRYRPQGIPRRLRSQG
jgi:uncharacterized C2H2 Zn-finger protein